MRSVMRACIGSNRAPDGRYAEIDLPASPYRLLNALDEIGIKSTKEIVYQEILNYGSFGYLEPHFDECQNMKPFLTKSMNIWTLPKSGGKPGNPKAASLPSEATVVVHGHPTASAVSCGGTSIDWITARNTVLTPSRFKKTTSTPPLCEP